MYSSLPHLIKKYDEHDKQERVLLVEERKCRITPQRESTTVNYDSLLATEERRNCRGMKWDFHTTSYLKTF